MLSRRIFLIINSEYDNECVGIFLYTELIKEFRVQIRKGIFDDRYPAIMGYYGRLGYKELPSNWAIRWVRERIIPPNRVNIKDTLSSEELKQYDEFDMLMYTNGRTCLDGAELREITEDEYTDYCKEYDIEVIPPPSNSNPNDETGLFND